MPLSMSLLLFLTPALSSMRNGETGAGTKNGAGQSLLDERSNSS